MFIIEILNWEKYNPRKDVKEPSWFRMNHGFFDNHEFFEFTAEEKLVWIYLLCQASKKNQATVHLVESHAVHSIWPPHHDVDQNVDQNAYHVRVIRQKTVVQAVEKLQKFGIVKIRTSRGRYADVTSLPATNERTDVRDETSVGGILNFDIPPDDPPPVRPTHIRINSADELLSSIPIFRREEWNQKFGADIVEREVKEAYTYHTADTSKAPRSTGKWQQHLLVWFKILGEKPEHKDKASSAATDQFIRDVFARRDPK